MNNNNKICLITSRLGHWEKRQWIPDSLKPFIFMPQSNPNWDINSVCLWGNNTKNRTK